MTDIYDQHKAAFANVSAYVVTKQMSNGGTFIARIAFKYPRNGAGRLYAYVHALGTQMVRGYASGGGYDKHSAAVHVATRRIAPPDREASPEFLATLEQFKFAVCDDGTRWSTDLEKRGFHVITAI